MNDIYKDYSAAVLGLRAARRSRNAKAAADALKEYSRARKAYEAAVKPSPAKKPAGGGA